MTPEQFKHHLMLLGETQTTFASKMGITMRAMAYWVDGTRPVPEYAISWIMLRHQFNSLTDYLKSLDQPQQPS